MTLFEPSSATAAVAAAAWAALWAGHMVGDHPVQSDAAATHAIIDRRWIVRHIIAAKGGCPNWPDGPYLCDQSIHAAALLVAAVAAAAVTSTATLAVLAVVCLPLIAAALTIEQHLAAAARRAPAPDPFRL